MTTYQFTNNAQTTLALAASAGSTTISVASSTAFPTSGDFTILIGSELLLVTGVVGTSWTVARAQEGTSAAAHDSGATVQHVLTAAFLNTVQSGLSQSGTTFPLSPASGDRYFRTDQGGEFYYDGTRWLSAWLETVPLHIQDGVAPLSANGTIWGGLPPYDVLLEEMHLTHYVNSPNDASNYWLLSLYWNSGSTITQISTGKSTAGYAVGGYATQSWLALNQGLSAPVTGLYVAATKTGTPGSLYLMASGRYRLIAT